MLSCGGNEGTLLIHSYPFHHTGNQTVNSQIPICSSSHSGGGEEGGGGGGGGDNYLATTRWMILSEHEYVLSCLATKHMDSHICMSLVYKQEAKTNDSHFIPQPFQGCVVVKCWSIYKMWIRIIDVLSQPGRRGEEGFLHHCLPGRGG